MVVQENLCRRQDSRRSLEKSERKHRLKQRFEVIRKLGQGTYGKVQLAINRETGQEVAIKTIKKAKIENEQDLVRIRREIQIMSSIQHPHIIHIYEVFENHEKIVLIMQYASGGELYDYLGSRKNLSEIEARRIFRQIASAVYYCHKNKICHRDLKLENILLDEKKNAKIADFGLSNVFDDRHQLRTFCGSPLYASPEIVKGTPYYGPEVDCWSMGVLLYTLIYGAMPFDGSNFKRLVRQISEGDYYEPKKKSDASGLIRRLLTVNAKKRGTISDICADWWVNRCYEHSLLKVAEDMANLTPVHLDVLHSLAPVSPAPPDDVLVVRRAHGLREAKQKPRDCRLPARVSATEQDTDVSTENLEADVGDTTGTNRVALESTSDLASSDLQGGRATDRAIQETANGHEKVIADAFAEVQKVVDDIVLQVELLMPKDDHLPRTPVDSAITSKPSARGAPLRGSERKDPVQPSAVKSSFVLRDPVSEALGLHVYPETKELTASGTVTQSSVRAMRCTGSVNVGQGRNHQEGRHVAVGRHIPTVRGNATTSPTTTTQPCVVVPIFDVISNTPESPVRKGHVGDGKREKALKSSQDQLSLQRTEGVGTATHYMAGQAEPFELNSISGASTDTGTTESGTNRTEFVNSRYHERSGSIVQSLSTTSNKQTHESASSDSQSVSQNARKLPLRVGPVDGVVVQPSVKAPTEDDTCCSRVTPDSVVGGTGAVATATGVSTNDLVSGTVTRPDISATISNSELSENYSSHSPLSPSSDLPQNKTTEVDAQENTPATENGREETTSEESPTSPPAGSVASSKAINKKVTFEKLAPTVNDKPTELVTAGPEPTERRQSEDQKLERDVKVCEGNGGNRTETQELDAEVIASVTGRGRQSRAESFSAVGSISGELLDKRGLTRPRKRSLSRTRQASIEEMFGEQRKPVVQPKRLPGKIEIPKSFHPEKTEEAQKTPEKDKKVVIPVRSVSDTKKVIETKIEQEKKATTVPPRRKSDAKLVYKFATNVPDSSEKEPIAPPEDEIAAGSPSADSVINAPTKVEESNECKKGTKKTKSSRRQSDAKLVYKFSTVSSTPSDIANEQSTEGSSRKKAINRAKDTHCPDPGNDIETALIPVTSEEGKEETNSHFDISQTLSKETDEVIPPCRPDSTGTTLENAPACEDVMEARTVEDKQLPVRSPGKHQNEASEITYAEQIHRNVVDATSEVWHRNSMDSESGYWTPPENGSVEVSTSDQAGDSTGFSEQKSADVPVVGSSFIKGNSTWKDHVMKTPGEHQHGPSSQRLPGMKVNKLHARLSDEGLGSGSLSSSVESDMNSWKHEDAGEMKRLSPEGRTCEHQSPHFSVHKSVEHVRPAPISRSCKKFSFARNGTHAQQLETAYVLTQTDKDRARLESILLSAGVQIPRDDYVKSREMSPLKLSNSESSSGSNDASDDVANWPAVDSSTSSCVSKDDRQVDSGHFHKERGKKPNRNEGHAEHERKIKEWRKVDWWNSHSTDKDSSDNDDDLDLFFDDSHPIMYGAEGLWQYLKAINKDVERVQKNPCRAEFLRSISHESRYPYHAHQEANQRNLSRSLSREDRRSVRESVSKNVQRKLSGALDSDWSQDTWPSYEDLSSSRCSDYLRDEDRTLSEIYKWEREFSANQNENVSSPENIERASLYGTLRPRKWSENARIREGSDCPADRKGIKMEKCFDRQDATELNPWLSMSDLAGEDDATTHRSSIKRPYQKSYTAGLPDSRRLSLYSTIRPRRMSWNDRAMSQMLLSPELSDLASDDKYLYGSLDDWNDFGEYQDSSGSDDVRRAYGPVHRTISQSDVSYEREVPPRPTESELLLYSMKHGHTKHPSRYSKSLGSSLNAIPGGKRDYLDAWRMDKVASAGNLNQEMGTMPVTSSQYSVMPQSSLQTTPVEKQSTWVPTRADVCDLANEGVSLLEALQTHGYRSLMTQRLHPSGGSPAFCDLGAHVYKPKAPEKQDVCSSTNDSKYSEEVPEVVGKRRTSEEPNTAIDRLAERIKMLKDRCQRKSVEGEKMKKESIEVQPASVQTADEHGTTDGKEEPKEESVSDRIWRKSFYSRFNETRPSRRRKSYKDVDYLGDPSWDNDLWLALARKNLLNSVPVPTRYPHTKSRPAYPQDLRVSSGRRSNVDMSTAPMKDQRRCSQLDLPFDSDLGIFLSRQSRLPLVRTPNDTVPSRRMPSRNRTLCDISETTDVADLRRGFASRQSRSLGDSGLHYHHAKPMDTHYQRSLDEVLACHGSSRFSADDKEGVVRAPSCTENDPLDGGHRPGDNYSGLKDKE